MSVSLLYHSSICTTDSMTYAGRSYQIFVCILSPYNLLSHIVDIEVVTTDIPEITPYHLRAKALSVYLIVKAMSITFVSL